MKTKKLDSKLSLKKQTISNLAGEGMQKARGGLGDYTRCPGGTSCPCPIESNMESCDSYYPICTTTSRIVCPTLP